MIIGLTGGTGTGKSSAAKYFENRGFFVLDFDLIAREVTKKDSECLKELADEFGSDIIDNDGNLKRKTLGSIVFKDSKKLEILNKITHKYILMKSDEIAKENQGKNLIFDAPLLFEAGLEKKCDYVICVLADKKNRLDRICQRDGLSLKDAKNRIDSQKDDSYYTHKSDFCVYNNNNMTDLEEQLNQILRSISDDSNN